MIQQLTEQQWQQIDVHLFAGHKLRALVAIREFCGPGINDAVDMMHARYKKLRTEKSDQFKQSDEEYWQGFYS